VLQDELGYEGTEKEIEELKAKGAKRRWPEVVGKHFFKELEKIQRMNPAAAEYPVAMNYVELLVDLPWGEYTRDNFDLAKAKKILDADHFGLEKVKERILEYLAVLKLKNNMKGPSCACTDLPAWAKPSLGRSVAKALGPQVHPHVAGRRARRGRNPGPPQNVRRGHARQDHSAPQEGQVVQPGVHPRRD
jgi:ATP-dependent Lon protease